MKRYILYRPRSTLPSNGWIQACIVCNIPTSHTVQWGKRPIVIYLCNRCIARRSEEIEKAVRAIFYITFPGHQLPVG